MTSPHLAPTSPHTPGATSKTTSPPRIPPYGGELVAEPTGHHPNNTHLAPHNGATSTPTPTTPTTPRPEPVR